VQVHRLLVWIARIEQNRITEVASWSSLESLPASPTPSSSIREDMPHVEENINVFDFHLFGSQMREYPGRSYTQVALRKYLIYKEIPTAAPGGDMGSFAEYRGADNFSKIPAPALSGGLMEIAPDPFALDETSGAFESSRLAPRRGASG
jgi:hypothetical protein